MATGRKTAHPIKMKPSLNLFAKLKERNGMTTTVETQAPAPQAEATTTQPTTGLAALKAQAKEGGKKGGTKVPKNEAKNDADVTPKGLASTEVFKKQVLDKPITSENQEQVTEQAVELIRKSDQNYVQLGMIVHRFRSTRLKETRASKEGEKKGKGGCALGELSRLRVGSLKVVDASVWLNQIGRAHV